MKTSVAVLFHSAINVFFGQTAIDENEFFLRINIEFNPEFFKSDSVSCRR